MPKIYDLGTITVSAAPQTGRLTSFTPSATQNQESRLSHEEAKVKTLVELERLIQDKALKSVLAVPQTGTMDGLRYYITSANGDFVDVYQPAAPKIDPVVSAMEELKRSLVNL